MMNYKITEQSGRHSFDWRGPSSILHSMRETNNPTHLRPRLNPSQAPIINGRRINRWETRIVRRPGFTIQCTRTTHLGATFTRIMTKRRRPIFNRHSYHGEDTDLDMLKWADELRAKVERTKTLALAVR